MQRRVKILSVAGGAVAGLLLVTSAAFACVSLATLDVTPGKGAAGTTVKADTTNLSTAKGASAAELHWGAIDGPMLATTSGTPTASSTSLNFTVPDAAAGTYVIVLTQKDPTGAPIWGMPARATFTVPGLAAGVAPALEAAPAPEQVTIVQKYLVAGQAPAAAPAKAAPAKAAPAPAQAAPAPAAAQPAQPLSLEARDAITQQVAPTGARQVNYVPASSRTQSSGSLSLHLGIALAVVGSMALLTAAGAAYILRPTQAKVSR